MTTKTLPLFTIKRVISILFSGLVTEHRGALYATMGDVDFLFELRISGKVTVFPCAKGGHFAYTDVQIDKGLITFYRELKAVIARMVVEGEHILRQREEARIRDEEERTRPSWARES